MYYIVYPIQDSCTSIHDGVASKLMLCQIMVFYTLKSINDEPYTVWFDEQL